MDELPCVLFEELVNVAIAFRNGRLCWANSAIGYVFGVFCD